MGGVKASTKKSVVPTIVRTGMVDVRSSDTPVGEASKSTVVRQHNRKAVRPCRNAHSERSATRAANEKKTTVFSEARVVFLFSFF